jgi:high affinity Mn2+ porin
MKLHNTIKFASLLLIVFLYSERGFAQEKQDDQKETKWNFHFQQTIVTQYHPTFHSPYEGDYSLHPKESAQTSLTSTFFFGARLWSGASVYFNPEIAGGSGLSQARGIAGFTNGETFRIGNPKPQIYVARAYIRQIIPLSGQNSYQSDNANQLGGYLPHSYVSISLGKFSVADFFDNNSYSHNPRNQFLNWGLMSNGAWDYPANTRGYTYGLVVEYVKKHWTVRLADALVPTYANGPNLNFKVGQNHSYTGEIQRNYAVHNRSGSLKLLGFFTKTKMGSYNQATQETSVKPDITLTRTPGRTKYGWGINWEQQVTDNAGVFMRASWNDGKNETWAFTEIDHSISGGFVLNGNKWNRKEDVIGIGLLSNGISKPHRNYLMAGGYGFMIGDGKLNYGQENIIEIYYSFKVPHYPFSISPDFQYVIHPGYNIDRGPVAVIGGRAHLEI